MKGVRESDLASILEFNHKGQAYVYQENIKSFLALAKYFKLEGHSEDEQDQRSQKLTSRNN